jgi:hypothetical protein
VAGADTLERALTTLRGETRFHRLEAPLQLLAEAQDHRVREALVAKYAEVETLRDSGAMLRTAIVRALRRHAGPEDLPLLERAARTYERLPPIGTEVAEALRAAALISMNEVDGTLASFHAVRLLFEPAALSGEPALTAVKLLASQGQLLPLYQSASTGEPALAPEVAGECLRSLAGAPLPVVRELSERYRDCQEEIVLLGLFDLLLTSAELNDYILGFLAETRLDGIFQWLVTTLVAARREDLLPALRQMAETEPDRTRRNILKEALLLT